MSKPREYYWPIINALGELKAHFAYFEFAGSWRRNTAECGDIDVVAVVERDEQFLKIGAWCERYGKKLYGKGDRVTAEIKIHTKVLGREIDCEANVDFRIHYHLDEWPSGLLHFTGSKEHNIMMRSRAKRYGFKLNEYGLWFDGDERVIAPSEAEIFSVLGMSYVPPHERG